jgi:hypothetical protein
VLTVRRWYLPLTRTDECLSVFRWKFPGDCRIFQWVKN